MKKLRSKSGMTLIEILAALLILVFLILGIGVGMDAGTRIYKDAIFEAETSALTGILNTSLGDILRYSVQVKADPDVHPGVTLKHKLSASDKAELVNRGVDADFVFTSVEYGIQDAYFYTPLNPDGTYSGHLLMRSLKQDADEDMHLINEGAYPNLEVTNFVITYSPRVGDGISGGYFEITYTIVDKYDTNRYREVEYIVRQMND